MKRVLIITLMLLLATTVLAQEYPTDKGSIILGGTMSYMSQSGDMHEVWGESVSTTLLAPSFGYFISPNVL